jgi:uncharacterized coiled-coil protein SlyX
LITRGWGTGTPGFQGFSYFSLEEILRPIEIPALTPDEVRILAIETVINNIFSQMSADDFVLKSELWYNVARYQSTLDSLTERLDALQQQICSLQSTQD